MNEIWFRAEVITEARWDYEYEVITGYNNYIRWIHYNVLRHTPKGVWVCRSFDRPRFILGTAVKQLCVPTPELAIRDAVERAKKNVKGCEARLNQAKAKLHVATQEAVRLGVVVDVQMGGVDYSNLWRESLGVHWD